MNGSICRYTSLTCGCNYNIQCTEITKRYNWYYKYTVTVLVFVYQGMHTHCGYCKHGTKMGQLKYTIVIVREQ